MLSKAFDVVKREPVRTVQLVLALLVAFGLALFTDTQTEAIIAIVAFLFGGGEVARRQVYPSVKVEGQVQEGDQGVIPESPVA